LKSIIRIVFIIIFSIFIINILSKGKSEAGQVKVQSTPAWQEYESIQLMAALENNMSKEMNDDTSTTSTDDLPDYAKLFPQLYTVNNIPQQMEGDRKIAYLTFDDGPSENTDEVLEVLKEKGVKATFFIVGSSITESGEVYLKEMVEQGHTIGIHTYSHLCNEIYCSIERFLNDFDTVYQQIYDITGEKVNIFRFPWGSNNGYSKSFKGALFDEMERRGFTYYDWNVSADDSIGTPTSYSIKKNIAKDLEKHNYPVILMHDSVINDLTAKTLPQIIDMIKDKGYEFDTLDHRKPCQFKR